MLTNQSGPSGQICLAFSNAEVSVNLALAKKILLKLCVRVEVSSVESNETTAATVSCDLAPPPQRRRRRHPSPPPPRILPFVTLPFWMSFVSWLPSPQQQTRDSCIDAAQHTLRELPIIIMFRVTKKMSRACCHVIRFAVGITAVTNSSGASPH